MMNIAFVISLVCFVVIAWYFYTEIKADKKGSVAETVSTNA
jgi:MFS transporter, FHS family, L-fucose permease